MENHLCPWWLAYTFDNPLRALFHRTDRIFSSFVKEGMIVADIGCGMGHFSLGLAKMVKANGKVFAVDIQEQMLAIVEKRAAKKGVSNIIHPHLCTENEIGIKKPVDMALSFWMLHETLDKPLFIRQVKSILKDSGLLLVAEPRLHVPLSLFEKEIQIALDEGFDIKASPCIALSHAVLLEKNQPPS